MPKLNILHHSHYPPKKDGHGGSKRTSQILEIVTDNEYVLTNLDVDVLVLLKNLKWTIIFYLYIGSAFKFIFNFKNKLSLKKLKRQDRLRHISTQIIDTLQVLPDIFLWESTLETHQFIAKALKDKGVKIIGIPHNLESLVPCDSKYGAITDNEVQIKRFENEVATLAVCDELFVISREEQWLLNLFRIKASYLPYYPIKETQIDLIEIRKKRTERIKNNEFLILGTALNPPTLKGMLAMINEAVKAFASASIHVAGYGTENLQTHLQHPNVILHGSVTLDRLNSLLEKVDAVLLNQPFTTGALTKIPEMLIAGIPIICNEAASRSFHNYSGLYIFHSESELNILLNTTFETPEFPVKNYIYEDLFIKALDLKH